MRSKIFIILLGLLLFSCGNKLPTNYISEPYVVTSIELYDNNFCTYHLQTGVDKASFIDNISVVDSIGKFKIGDNLNLSLYKRK